jgi:hypothetical protein
VWWCRSSVPRARTCSPRGCTASEYVFFDAEDEPPGASADGAASGLDSITQKFGV